MKQLEISVRVYNNLLRERRLRDGLSQKELGMVTGVPVSYISAFETFKKIGISAVMVQDYQKRLANFFVAP